MNRIYTSKIVLLDDNKELCKMVSYLLQKAGFARVITVNTITEARRKLLQEQIDLWILDINLPDGDGFSFLQEIRRDFQGPVLFLSARDEDEDRLLGLGLGADDYMTKPFLPRELILRVTAILKRTYYSPEAQRDKEKQLVLGTRVIAFEAGVVRSEKGEQSLTAKELALLRKLAENRGKIVTFDSLCETIWGDGYYGYENTLMVHIRRLREKIEENPSNPRWILTVRGLGYKMSR